MIHYSLSRRKSTPGSAVQRFGDWRKGTPNVLIENRQWAAMGKPDFVRLTIDPRDEDPAPIKIAASLPDEIMDAAVDEIGNAFDPPTCDQCDRDLHGYRGPLCRYCDPNASSE